MQRIVLAQVRGLRLVRRSPCGSRSPSIQRGAGKSAPRGRGLPPPPPRSPCRTPLRTATDLEALGVRGGLAAAVMFSLLVLLPSHELAALCLPPVGLTRIGADGSSDVWSRSMVGWLGAVQIVAPASLPPLPSLPFSQPPCACAPVEFCVRPESEIRRTFGESKLE